MKLKAKTTDAVSPLEEHGRALARTIAQSGMVLLQNNGVLPLKTGSIALYGSGARHTVTGGSGSGEELYQQIQDEKRALIKAGKSKKEKPLPEITEGDIPFEIPESWK